MSTKPDFAALVDLHGKEIFVFLYRLLRESSEAEDCLQEAFLRAYQAYDRLEQPANVRAWLYRIAHNTAMTRLNRRTRQLEILTGEVVSPAPSVERQIEQRQALDQLREAVESLPPKQRAALVMRKFQQLGYDEIAVALEINPGAARANVYQGLKKLRQQFSADGSSAPGSGTRTALPGGVEAAERGRS